jgi:aminotransferase
MYNLSTRTEVIGPSKIEQSLRILEQNPEIISLGAGEPDFPAPKNVIKAAKKYLDKGFTHYAPLQGKIELREAIAKKLKNENKMDVNADDVIVTCGSKEALLLAFLVSIDAGDEVIIPNPTYLAYSPMVQMLDGISVPIQLREENNFELIIDDAKDFLTNKTKMLVICNPSNPTGAVYSKKALEEIADFAIENNIMILVDEAYEKLVYEGKHVSLASLNGMKDHVITTQTFSKTFAMTGFRVGYAVAPENVIKEMKEFKMTTTLAAPTAFQMAAVDALKNSAKYVEKMKREYTRRRKFLIKRLNEIPKISCSKPKGAFYAFPNVSKLGMSSEKAVDFLLKKAKVMTIPGNEFGNYGERFIRLSYATEYKKIEKAMERIETAIRKL